MPTPTPFSTGRSTGGKPINLAQLQAEMGTAEPLGMVDTLIFPYDADGDPTDFPAAQEAAVDAAIAAHVAMRNTTDQEYAAEFQATATTPERKQEIRDIMDELLPREQVPMTQADWEALSG